MNAKTIVLVSSALMLSASYRAGAQEAGPAGEARANVDLSAIDEIVVMARKRSERLIEIPETISVLTADQIERSGIASLNDVGRQTPNIVLNRRQDNEPNVVIRGVGAFGNTQGIGFYVDDVQNFTDQSAAVEDVERIEILKGPQGTLYGGSNVGGAIKYVLKQPGDELGFEGKAEYGSFGTTNVFAAANVPASETFAMRVSGYSNRTDGYVRNSFIGGRPDESEEWGTRVAFGWQPSDRLDVQFSYRHNELDNGGNIYVIAADGADYSRVVDYNNDVTNERQVDGGILTVTYDVGVADLTSVTSYTRRDTQFAWDLDYTSADAVFGRNGDRHDTDVFTQELRLTSTGGGALDWLVGAYYAAIDNRTPTNNADVTLGVDAGGPIFIKNIINGDAEERQYAVFGTSNYNFGKFRVGGGLRVARSEYTGRILNDPIVGAEVNDTSVLPKLTLAYDITDTAMLYGNVALGSEPGKVNVGTGAGSTYRPERATSVEAGIKGTAFGRAVTYEFAAFHIDYRRRQFETRFVAPSGIITEETTNIGRSISYGVEAGLSYQPISALTLSASGGWLHSEWNDRNARFNLAPVDGLRVPFAPKFSGNAAIDYRQPLGDRLELGMRADVSYLSSFFWDVPNASSQPSYEIVNVRLSISDPQAGWEVAVRGENVSDSEYFTEYTPDVFGPGRGLGAPGTPAKVIASVSFTF
jgi:iron complex outermembrane recepter protein